MKKIILLIVLAVPLLIVGAGLYSMTKGNIEDVVICSTNNESHYMPQAVCQYYLLNHRLTQDDIQYLENYSSGLAFLFSMQDKEKRIKYLNHFVSKGVSVDKQSVIDGFTPLHAAIILNEPELVKFLLEKGANPALKDKQFKLTSIEFIDYLSRKDPSTDRSQVSTTFVQ